MFKIQSRKIETVTRSTAAELLTFNNYQSQRNLRQHNVNYLAEKMKSGEFRTAEIALAAMPDGTVYLMNGQHVLHAAIESKTGIKALIERFACETEEDLSHLFRQYDCTPIRSLRDMVKVEVDALKLGWPYKTGALVVGALFALSGMGNNTNRTIRVELLKDHQKDGNFVNSILTGAKEGQILERVPVVASMIETYRKNAKDAETFWCSVRDGEMLTREMPAWRLRAFLIDSMRPRRSLRKDYRAASAREIRHRCILAWNAFRKGESTRLTYRAGKPLPKVV